MVPGLGDADATYSQTLALKRKSAKSRSYSNRQVVKDSTPKHRSRICI
jgi:hypothetical protein